MEENRIKQKVQSWMVVLSVIILIAKFIAFFLTNSIGIFTDAMESIVNVTAGLISLYSIHWASKPKDKQHPFGHGKGELISASIEGVLIMMAGALIVYEGIHRLFESAEIQQLDLGIIVVAIGGLMNYVMGWYSIRMGKQHQSVALIAGGKHLQSDTYSTIGLVVGLILLYITKLAWIDSLLALIFGSIIIITGISILRKTIENLTDKADEALLQEMVETISANRKPHWIDVHNTKMLKYGNSLFVDCDLTLPWYYNIKQSHQACDELKSTLEAVFTENVQVSIHSDPCLEKHCEHCTIDPCNYRKCTFESAEQITMAEITQSDEERQEE